MKKGLLIIVACLTVLSMFFALPASPAAAQGNEQGLTLIFIQYIPGKGVTFKFEVKGDFDNFTGFATINGHEYALTCNINDDGDLSCTAEQGLQQYVGEIASVTINGYTFSAPIRGSAPVVAYCYPVFDQVNTENGGEEPPVPTVSESTPWEQAGTYCQAAPANVGDEIYWYNPAYSSSWYYYYSLDGQDIWTNPPDMGPGYYWDIILS